MSRIKPTKKRAGLVHGNLYRVTKAEGLVCTGKKWMTRAEAEIHIRIKTLYEQYQKDKAEDVEYAKQLEKYNA